MGIIPLPICSCKKLATNIQESFSHLCFHGAYHLPCWWWGQNGITIMRTEYQLITLRQRLVIRAVRSTWVPESFIFLFPSPRPTWPLHISLYLSSQRNFKLKTLSKIPGTEWSFYKCYLSALVFILLLLSPFSDEKTHTD